MLAYSFLLPAFYFVLQQPHCSSNTSDIQSKMMTTAHLEQAHTRLVNNRLSMAIINVYYVFFLQKFNVSCILIRRHPVHSRAESSKTDAGGPQSTSMPSRILQRRSAAAAAALAEPKKSFSSLKQKRKSHRQRCTATNTKQ